MHDPDFVPFAGTADFNFVPRTAVPAGAKTMNKISFAWFGGTYAGACNLAQRLRVCRAETLTMKTSTLIIIASLAALASSANAASKQSDSDPVVLPAYLVTAPRYLPVEKQINASLQELREQANTPMVVAPELTIYKAQDDVRNPMASAAKAAVAGRLAKS